MDYIKIHNNFVELCKNTTPKQRLQNRNKEDSRLNSELLYTEEHHTIPISIGGINSELIKLLPEEHLFIHKLRYKAFNEKESMLAVRYMLNGFNNKTQGNFKEIKLSLTKAILKGYAFIKQESYNFRKIHGWQSYEGLKNISKAMKNKLIVKDAKTGELMGKHDKNHPKILSGEWVHHSKGYKTVINTITGEKERIKIENTQSYHQYIKCNKGSNNPKAYDLSTEQILELCLKIVEEHQQIFGISKIRMLIKEKYNIIIPHTGLGYRVENPSKYLIEYLEKQTGLKYDPYYNKRNKNVKN